jgi:threonine dehydrogenase-like Zn-dependent dehydrogenase
MYRHWRQGEHVIIIGGTGRGKTYLASQLMPILPWTLVTAIKKRDETLERFESIGGYRVITSWKDIRRDDRHVILHAYPPHLGEYADARARIFEALDQVYQLGGWSVFLDDMNELSAPRTWGLGDTIREMLNLVRSGGTSMVAGVPRPARNPVETRTQARYVLAFAYANRLEIDSIADIMGIERRVIRALMLGNPLTGNTYMGLHDFLFADTVLNTLSLVRG